MIYFKQMRPIHYILICCLLGTLGCSKDDVEPNNPSYSNAPYCSQRIWTVNYLPAINQNITLFNACIDSMSFGNLYLEHSSDTNKFNLPPGTILAGADSILITGTELGFVIDTIADTIWLKDRNSNQIKDRWHH